MMTSFKTFAEATEARSSDRLWKLLCEGSSELAFLQSEEFMAEYVALARSEPLPRSAEYSPYTFISRARFCGKGIRADRHLVAAARLVCSHCNEHSLSAFIYEDDNGIQVMVHASPIGAIQMRYRLGMRAENILKFCQDCHCDPDAIIPFFSRYMGYEKVNPANWFPALPDNLDIWKTYFKYAN